MAVATALSSALLVVAVQLLFVRAAESFMPPPADRAGTQLAVTDWLLRQVDDAGVYEPELALDLARVARVERPQLVGDALAKSAWLAILAQTSAILAGVPLGLWIGRWRSRVRRELASIGLSMGLVFPAYFLVFLLQVAAVELSSTTGRTIIPVFGYGLDSHLLIPVTALAVGPAAMIARMTAIHVEEIVERDFVRTAHAKGIPSRAVVLRHVLPNILPGVSAAALSGFQLLLGSLVIVEYVFAWPGVGLLALRALRGHDLPVLLACVAILAGMLIMLEEAIEVASSTSARP